MKGVFVLLLLPALPPLLLMRLLERTCSSVMPPSLRLSVILSAVIVSPQFTSYNRMRNRKQRHRLE